jgi:hypothetical protein
MNWPPLAPDQPAGASSLIGPAAVLEQIANCIPLRRQASLANRSKIHRSSKHSRFASGRERWSPTLGLSQSPRQSSRMAKRLVLLDQESFRGPCLSSRKTSRSLFAVPTCTWVDEKRKMSSERLVMLALYDPHRDRPNCFMFRPTFATPPMPAEQCLTRRGAQRAAISSGTRRSRRT